MTPHSLRKSCGKSVNQTEQFCLSLDKAPEREAFLDKYSYPWVSKYTCTSAWTCEANIRDQRWWALILAVDKPAPWRYFLGGVSVKLKNQLKSMTMSLESTWAPPRITSSYSRPCTVFWFLMMFSRVIDCFHKHIPPDLYSLKPNPLFISHGCNMCVLIRPSGETAIHVLMHLDMLLCDLRMASEETCHVFFSFFLLALRHYKYNILPCKLYLFYLQP